MREGVEQAVSRQEDRDDVRLHRRGGLLSATIPFPTGSGRPESWLELAPARNRGAWLGRDGWAVHGGASARLTAPPEDRFRRLATRASSALGEGDRPVPADPEVPEARLYGGFSYGRTGTGLWDGFPGARFVLPRWEIRRVGDRTTLLVHRLLEEGAEGPGRGSEAGDDLVEAARSLRSRLLERGSRSRAEEGSGPGTSGTGDGAGAAGEERERWLAVVREALDAIRAGDLQKVVLARSLAVATGVGPLEALARLRSRPTGPGTFLLQSGEGSAFLASSPELLAEVRGTRFAATAVAGSAERGASPREDRERARTLAESRKDRREQAIVAEDILERLSTLATAVRVSDPTVLELPEILHLESRVEARLPGRLHVLEILDRIHPTPAVCGRPREAADAFLRRYEAMDRGWYAGPVGWFDLSGDGSFSPALRSGLWTGEGWRLFAGAGIVDGSQPEREWEETELKLQAIRRGFGLAGP